jgi:hypothetical protein
MPDRIEAIRARLDEWRNDPDATEGDIYYYVTGHDMTWLLDEVDALRERVAILRADLEDLEDMADARGGDA